jgi:hypothetical protein
MSNGMSRIVLPGQSPEVIPPPAPGVGTVLSTIDKILTTMVHYNPDCDCHQCKWYRDFRMKMEAQMPPDHVPVSDPAEES